MPSAANDCLASREPRRGVMATEASEVTVTAVVKWFDRKKGFGFATPEEGGEDIFVHQRNIVADGKSPVLDEGDTIHYKLGEHNGRPTAIEVRLPVGHEPSFEKRRRRGRNAKKEADAEAAKEGEEAVEKAKGELAQAPNGAGDEKPKEPRLGPDGKPWRKVSRPRVPQSSNFQRAFKPNSIVRHPNRLRTGRPHAYAAQRQGREARRRTRRLGLGASGGQKERDQAGCPRQRRSDGRVRLRPPPLHTKWAIERGRPIALLGAAR